MGNMPTSNGNSSLPSDAGNNNNVSKLSALAEQLQLTNKIGPRRFFCDDVLLDVLHFLRRKEHAQVRLACRRLLWLSDTACARYPPRVVHHLEVSGFSLFNRLPIANSIRVHPVSGSSYLAEFPTMAPPEDIVHLSRLEISDIIGLELLRFLRFSARLFGKCYMAFSDFDNFVRHYSAKFIAYFFGLFPSGSNRTIELCRLSYLAAPLFRDHPSMFDCTILNIECLDSFPLDALQCWLHLDEQLPPNQKLTRYLVIFFKDEVHESHSIASVGHFVQQIRQRFLNATSCCPFTVGIRLFEDSDIPELDTFVEDNERTGEVLEFGWLQLHQVQVLYRMRRKRRESTGQGEGDGEAEKETVVYIREVVQGDK